MNTDVNTFVSSILKKISARQWGHTDSHVARHCNFQTGFCPGENLMTNGRVGRGGGKQITRV